MGSEQIQSDRWAPHTLVPYKEDCASMLLCPPLVYLRSLFLTFRNRKLLISCLLRAVSLTPLLMKSSLGKSSVGCSSVLCCNTACQLRDFTRCYGKYFSLYVSQHYYSYKVL